MLKRTSIRTKLNYNFVVIIVITIVIFEAIFTYGIHAFYYTNIEQVLLERMSTTLSVYDTYRGYENLGSTAKFILENEAVPDYVEAQVIALDGRIVESTSRYRSREPVSTDDFISAKTGETTVWRGKNPETSEYIMAVSAPIHLSGSLSGVVRYVTSVEKVGEVISSYLLYAYLIGLVVLLSVVYLSTIMANKIIKPIYELKNVADHIATGDFKIRASNYELDEIGELAETINYMADEINKTEKLKNDFISSISHELRTPLTSIKGWSETILTGDIKNVDETKLGLEMISRESERLHGLVENMLDFSKLEAERVELNLTRFDIVELANRVFNQLSINIKAHDLHYRVTSIEREIVIDGDRNKLRQVLINILDNAIKHTPPEGVISCQISSRDNFAIIVLKDTGSGIEPQHLNQIADQFYKANPNSAGSGLGLAITRRIIELHHGEMTIDSALNSGTTITLKLPLNHSEVSDVL